MIEDGGGDLVERRSRGINNFPIVNINKNGLPNNMLFYDKLYVRDAGRVFDDMAIPNQKPFSDLS